MSSIYHHVVEALVPLIQAFEQFGIPYYIGGSVSSSFHGTERRTQDVDIIVAVRPDQIRALARLLQQDYYLDEAAWLDATRHGLSYSVLYLKSMTKIDVMPLRARAFTREEERRAQPHVLEPGTPPLRLASAEDTVLTKLEWIHLGGRSSHRQWTDILGILKRQGDAIHLGYLRQWADILSVRDLLEQALLDAGFTQP